MNQHSIQNNHLQVVVASRGAELQSISDRQRQTEYLWQGEERYWADRSPLLFPIIGRLRNGVYSCDGNTFSMELHGFIKDQVFQSTTITGDRIVLQTESTPETMQQYPFAFRFLVEYVLVDASLVISFQIENTGDRPMPFSLGTHPGFRVPLADGERFEDYSLCFEQEEYPHKVELDGVFIAGKTSIFPLVSNRILPLRHGLFDQEAIILGGIHKKSVSLIDPSGTVCWSLDFADFDYLTLWQPPQTDAPFVCLECWNGLPDPACAKSNALDQKPGTRILAPGTTTQASVKILFTP